MPFTPYHFGPSGFLGLVFRKWIDLPVFVLANVIVDLEVLAINVAGLGWPYHRYCHTLLIGTAVGVLWAIAAYRLRNTFTKIMHLLRMPYQTSLAKMIISGILGVWLHVLIDGVYHYDVRAFWPNKRISLWRMMRRYIGQDHVKIICVALFVAAVILYVFMVKAPSKKNKRHAS
ncbi:MAG: hypothetical protein ACYTEL_16555 [Planctomycetota bacterium]|jgi:membrane-bound metal-dependent hydrolase YbcI (DUF457 family)